MCVYIDIWTVLTDKMSLFVTSYEDCNNTGDSVRSRSTLCCPLVLDNDAIFVILLLTIVNLDQTIKMWLKCSYKNNCIIFFE